jgi:hypothetical protein
MLAAARTLEPKGNGRLPKVLTQDEIVGLEENARRVAAVYWSNKGGTRTSQSLQNQLNLGRWHYLDQAPFAKAVLLEIAADSGLTFRFYP